MVGVVARPRTLSSSPPAILGASFPRRPPAHHFRSTPDRAGIRRPPCRRRHLRAFELPKLRPSRCHPIRQRPAPAAPTLRRGRRLSSAHRWLRRLGLRPRTLGAARTGAARDQSLRGSLRTCRLTVTFRRHLSPKHGPGARERQTSYSLNVLCRTVALSNSHGRIMLVGAEAD